MYFRRNSINRFKGKTLLPAATVVLFSALLLPTHTMSSELDTFLVKCGVCHKKGGKAAPVNPADKAGVVWKKYFQRNRHPVDLSATITPREQKEILNFLEHHAADSDHPVAAIIPK